jgi:Rps23 Pro-64 3,4-dihydroxylase Tpa1-like proline 4-hydroxylase
MGTDRFIKTYDDLFTYDQQYHLYQYFKKSLFRAIGEDSDLNLYPSQQIYSDYSLSDLSTSGFQNTPGYEKLNKEYKLSERSIKKVRVNLSQYGEKNSAHTDSAGLTLIYYPSPDWKIEWGGHTIFLNERLDDIIFISAYKTGRVLLFDGTIPHLFVPPTTLSPVYRLSFVIQFT